MVWRRPPAFARRPHQEDQWSRVASVASVKSALAGSRAKPALMLLTREGADIFIALPSSRS
jgi:hypothetical protein